MSALGWLRRRLLEPDYPLTAIEVRERSVGAIRLVRERKKLALAAAAVIELPEGVVKLSMTEPNVLDPAAFRAALRGALERAGILNAGRVALVLPDPVARVAILPAVELKGRQAEVDEMVRFRLRKAVPFEIRDARVMAIPAGAAGTTVVGAIYRPVLEGYEEACHAQGLQPGLVELAGLALVEGDPRTGGDRLVVNWDEGYVSFLLTRNGAPLLIRTLVGGSASAPDQVAREAASTAVYYSERLGGTGFGGAVVRSTVLPPAEAAAVLREPLGVLPEVLDPWRILGLTADRLESAQALAAAASCVLGRAA